MIRQVLAVAVGGAIGAVFRYALSLIPIKSAFPLMTFLTNFIGAFVIGMLAGMAQKGDLNAQWQLFFKTGVCGGFTTFSTFSLESVQLLTGGHVTMGCVYIAASVAVCLLGVVLGNLVVEKY